MTDLTLLEAVTLAAVADKPRYGYELVQRVAELTDGRLTIRPGNLYRVLHRLEQAGLVRELPEYGGASVDERRRYFRATAKGRRAAAQELAVYARVLQRTPSLREALGDG
jgi:DNA-binding PadR family transcriptional regulator